MPFCWRWARMPQPHSGGVGLASIAARENLIDLAGGLDKLSQKTQSYYASFTILVSSCSALQNRRRLRSTAALPIWNLAVPTSKRRSAIWSNLRI